MKIKLFNGKCVTQNLAILSGGFDQETGKCTVVVREGDEAAGVVTLDVSEANVLINILSSNLPKVERVAVTQARGIGTDEALTPAVARTGRTENV